MTITHNCPFGTGPIPTGDASARQITHQAAPTTQAAHTDFVNRTNAAVAATETTANLFQRAGTSIPVMNPASHPFSTGTNVPQPSGGLQGMSRNGPVAPAPSSNALSINSVYPQTTNVPRQLPATLNASRTPSPAPYVNAVSTARQLPINGLPSGSSSPSTSMNVNAVASLAPRSRSKPSRSATDTHLSSLRGTGISLETTNDPFWKVADPDPLAWMILPPSLISNLFVSCHPKRDTSTVVRCFRYSIHGPHVQPAQVNHEWPADLQIRIAANRTLIDLTKVRRSEKYKHYKDSYLDVSVLALANDLGSLKLSFESRAVLPTSFFVCLQAMRAVSVQELIDSLRSSPHKILTVEASKQNIIQSFARNDLVAFEKVSLKDPQTMMRVNIPARGSNCLHWGCFDLYFYLSANKNIRTWLCPRCNQYTPFDSLIIDSYFEEALLNFPDDDELVLHADSSLKSESSSRSATSTDITSSETTTAQNTSSKSSSSSSKADNAPLIIDLLSDDEEDDIPTRTSTPVPPPAQPTAPKLAPVVPPILASAQQAPAATTPTQQALPAPATNFYNTHGARASAGGSQADTQGTLQPIGFPASLAQSDSDSEFGLRRRGVGTFSAIASAIASRGGTGGGIGGTGGIGGGGERERGGRGGGDGALNGIRHGDTPNAHGTTHRQAEGPRYHGIERYLSQRDHNGPSGGAQSGMGGTPAGFSGGLSINSVAPPPALSAGAAPYSTFWPQIPFSNMYQTVNPPPPSRQGHHQQHQQQHQQHQQHHRSFSAHMMPPQMPEYGNPFDTFRPVQLLQRQEPHQEPNPYAINFDPPPPHYHSPHSEPTHPQRLHQSHPLPQQSPRQNTSAPFSPAPTLSDYFGGSYALPNQPRVLSPHNPLPRSSDDLPYRTPEASSVPPSGTTAVAALPAAHSAPSASSSDQNAISYQSTQQDISSLPFEVAPAAEPLVETTSEAISEQAAPTSDHMRYHIDLPSRSRAMTLADYFSASDADPELPSNQSAADRTDNSSFLQLPTPVAPPASYQSPSTNSYASPYQDPISCDTITTLDDHLHRSITESTTSPSRNGRAGLYASLEAQIDDLFERESEPIVEPNPLPTVTQTHVTTTSSVAEKEAQTNDSHQHDPVVNHSTPNAVETPTPTSSVTTPATPKRDSVLPKSVPGGREAAMKLMATLGSSTASSSTKFLQHFKEKDITIEFDSQDE